MAKKAEQTELSPGEALAMYRDLQRKAGFVRSGRVTQTGKAGCLDVLASGEAVICRRPFAWDVGVYFGIGDPVRMLDFSIGGEVDATTEARVGTLVEAGYFMTPASFRASSEAAEAASFLRESRLEELHTEIDQSRKMGSILAAEAAALRAAADSKEGAAMSATRRSAGLLSKMGRILQGHKVEGWVTLRERELAAVETLRKERGKPAKAKPAPLELDGEVSFFPSD